MASSAVDLNRVAGQSSSQAMEMAGRTNSYMEQVLGIQQANTAQNAQMASEQRDWSAKQAELTRQYNAAEAARNRDWQQYMSNTAHQREVADLMAAGLNPVLSATGGNGAAVTSGATASASNPSGASSQADTSASQAIVSLLGSSLTAMTRLADMSTSALTSEAVADKYTAAQRLAALISADAAKYGADQSSAASRYSADTHADATRDAAMRSAGASMYATDAAMSNAQYAADSSAAASRYHSDKALEGTKYSADKSAGSRDRATEAGYKSDLYGRNISGLYGLAEAILRGLW